MRRTLDMSHSSRMAIFSSSLLLIFSGAFGYSYAVGPGHFWTLATYAGCLSVSSWILARPGIIFWEAEKDEKTACDSGAPVSEPFEEHTAPGEIPKQPTRSEPVSKPRPPAMVQPCLDLDGLSALRSLNQLTARWLVSDASDDAANLIRGACLDRIGGGETEVERAERWFDIADGLRSRECRSLPKAELRRAFVADRVGVSKEQVRQIDQGRYAPLNKLLEEVDPKSL